MEDCQNLLERAREQVPSPQELTQELAEAGAQTAAAEVAEDIPQDQNVLTTGAIDLSELEAPEEEIQVDEEVQEEVIE